MSIQVQSDMEFLHPILQKSCSVILKDVIQKYNMPFRLFETGRSYERHQSLLTKGRTQNVVSKHLYDLSAETPLYSAAVDYVFFNGRWSWNLRNNTIKSWYELFGNIVLDTCPELKWGGTNRKSMNFTHFELREDIVLDNIHLIPCTLHL